MESDRRLRNYFLFLWIFVVGMALQGGVDLYRSTRDMFPQQHLPSLGVTADTTIHVLQARMRDQNLLAGLELLAGACLVAALVLQLSSRTRAGGMPGN